MKLKYKKMILMVSMCTMGIGMVTFSVNRTADNNSTKVENKDNEMLTYNNEDSVDSEDNSTADLLSASILSSLLPTPMDDLQTELTTAETNVLEKDAYADINSLISEYLNAKLSKDVETFKPLVNDVNILDMSDIQRKTMYIEKYENLVCYTKKGPEENSFSVYAYHEIKFTSIDTMAPAMNEFYVKQNEDGEFFIYLGEIDKDTEQYLDENRESVDVVELISSVNEKLRAAIENDGPLQEFCLKLEQSAQSVSKNE